MSKLEEIAQNVIEGQRDKVAESVRAALTEGVEANEILNGGLIAGMTKVGELFREDEMFVPEVLMAAKAMRAGTEVLEPHLLGKGAKTLGKVVLGTVKGDIHEIGKNLVAIMLRGAGFEVVDIGVEAPAEKFVTAAKSEGAQVVGMSSLLTSSMPALKTTIEAFKAAGLRDSVKIIVGGAVVTQKYADEIGADGYAPDAGAAIDKVKTMVGIK
ncbi:MAG: corrinoid protein [Chloroflexota bacterium]